MKTPYDAITRWRKLAVDDLRRDMAALELERDRLLAQLAMLDARQVREFDIASQMPFADFVSYDVRAKLERRRVSDALNGLEDDLLALQEALREAFGEYKAYDLAAERFRDAARLDAARREQQAFDEIAAQRFQRQD